MDGGAGAAPLLEGNQDIVLTDLTLTCVPRPQSPFGLGAGTGRGAVSRLFIGSPARAAHPVDVVRSDSELPPGRPLGRRAFLGLVGAGLTSLVWGDAAWRGLSRLAEPATRALPADVRAALPAPGSGWRIYSVNPPMPTFDPATWRLKVDGIVREPLSLSYDQLRALPRAEQVADFHCVTGWTVPDVHWAGVWLRDLVAAAAPRAGARVLVFVSAEQPYVDTLTLEQSGVPDAMVAYEMDGRPLSRPHGAPARLVMPRMYGYKGVKWLERIVVADQDVDGFWEQRGYDRDAWVGHSNGLA